MVAPGLAVLMAAATAATPILDRAIAAAGGAQRLESYPAFEWKGRAAVHGERTITIEGRWRIEPPDRAVVETHDSGPGAGSLRRMILDGDRGWGQRDGPLEPLPEALVAHERDQFYLYYVLRLVPLRSGGFQVTALGPDSLGNDGLRVASPGRRDLDLYFDKAARPARLVTSLADPASGKEIVEELRFRGIVEKQGVRWPRRIEITWDGRPYFELDIDEFSPLPRLDPSLFEGPK
ncbi:MAG: hypothetical protein DMF82_13275 [Acidobacteria bacterium]|nr:MAG: hypothetical protein DMF82_13275 [Acidobacteriota bacterium]